MSKSQISPIGLFDSGVGGLTVLKELAGMLPNENYLYFGDTARIPYGEKTKEQLISYVRGIMEWFKSQNVKAVAMACNTSSATAYDEVKNDYDFPVFNIIEPTAEYISYLDAQKIGVIATSATVNSKAYSKYIHKNNPETQVYEQACPGLVELVEHNRIDTFEAKKLVIKYVLPLLKENVDKIVLGCTHYPYLKHLIADVTGDEEMLINPAKHLSQKIMDVLMEQGMLNTDGEGTRKYYASANAQAFVEVGKRFYSDIQEAEELFIPEITNVYRA
ncbi:MAG: glutamate racemase [Candidatus Gastranaerophilales bacterium]|jgi:glutamate racemase|nr:glutamate racemase [Candidatus Gastranaerophilales bacterium]